MVLPGIYKLQDMFAESLNQAAGWPAVLPFDLSSSKRFTETYRESKMNLEESQVSDLFLERLEAAPAWAQKFVDEIERHLDDINDASVGYARVPDMRIRSWIAGRRTPWNAVTFKWTPTKQRFLMRSLLRDSELKKFGLRLDRPGSDPILPNESYICEGDVEGNMPGILDAIDFACETRAERPASSIAL